MKLLNYLNNHYKETRDTDVEFDSIEELKAEIGEQEVDDVIIEFAEEQDNYETRAYVINVEHERVQDMDVMDFTDDEFITEAETQGRVYTLAGFQKAFNDNEINSFTDVILFREVPVSH